MIKKTYPITEQLITNALQLANELYTELNHEADSLKKTQNTDLINEIAANKKQLVAQFELFNSQLAQVLETERLSNNQESMMEYFNRGKTAGISIAQTVDNWTLLMQVCAKCKILNEQNGASIELLSRHTKRSLDTLKGKPEFANTYGADGSAQSDKYTHRLISV
jgi:flagella synthesis protein FlgN